jgi:hypothetical protein
MVDIGNWFFYSIYSTILLASVCLFIKYVDDINYSTRNAINENMLIWMWHLVNGYIVMRVELALFFTFDKEKID